MSGIVHFDKVPVGRSPVVVGAVSSGQTLRADALNRLRLDVAEFRLDLTGFVSGWEACAEELRRAGKPVLYTLRSAEEGGRWSGTDSERLDAYVRSLAHVAALDVEAGSSIAADVASAAHDAGKAVVLSYHAFDAMPPQDALNRVVDRGFALGADIVKIAARTETRADVDVLAAILDQRGGRLVSCVGMGPLGPSSRVELALRGSCLTYGFADTANAPGQVSSAELMELLKAARRGQAQ